MGEIVKDLLGQPLSIDNSRFQVKTIDNGDDVHRISSKVLI